MYIIIKIKTWLINAFVVSVMSHSIFQLTTVSWKLFNACSSLKNLSAQAKATGPRSTWPSARDAIVTASFHLTHRWETIAIDELECVDQIVKGSTMSSDQHVLLYFFLLRVVIGITCKVAFRLLSCLLKVISHIFTVII